jgi:iron(III) transport system permease protein
MKIWYFHLPHLCLPLFHRSSEKFVTVSSRGFKPVVIGAQEGEDSLVHRSCVWVSFVLIVLRSGFALSSFVPYSMVLPCKGVLQMNLDHWKTVMKDPISCSLEEQSVPGNEGAPGYVLSLLSPISSVKGEEQGPVCLSRLVSSPFPSWYRHR